MSDRSIDRYIAQLEATIREVKRARSANERTTDFTVIRYDQTRRDRLWQMKVDERMVDSVLVCPEDGHRELVHIDIIREMDKDSVPFYEKCPNKSDHNLDLYQVDRNIPSTQLTQIVYFAYNGRCELNEKLAMSLAESAHEFGISSLLEYSFTYLRDHFHVGIAIQAFELAVTSLSQQKQFFQNYVEDNIEQLWLTNREDFLTQTYETLVQLLTSDWLNVKCESTVWQVIEAWIGHAPVSRLTHLSSLLKETLRFGRLPSSFDIEQSILSNVLYLSQSVKVCQQTTEFSTRVLNEARQKPVDGNGLPYDESMYNLRARNPNQWLIVAGGQINPFCGAQLQVYDYQLNLWRNSPVKLPEKVRFFEMQIIGSSMYVFGGVIKHLGRRRCTIDRFNAKLYSLNLAEAKPKWVSLAPMHIARCEACSVVLNGKLIVIGGQTYKRGVSLKVANCEQYDPISDVWTEIASLNRARYSASATVHNERIYVAGGLFVSGDDGSSTVEVYNPQSNHWQLVAPMSSPRHSFALVSYHDRILAIGGNLDILWTDMESYNQATNSWTEATRLSSDRVFRGALLNGQLMVTDDVVELSMIQNYDSNVHLTRLCSIRPRSYYSLVVADSRLAIAFNKP